MSMKTWQEEAMENEWVKVTEGLHTITLLEPPERETSLLTGKPQWVFLAQVDGEEGKFAPSKRLLRICAEELKRVGDVMPCTFRVNRIGTDTSTKYIVVRG